MKICFFAPANTVHSYRWIRYFVDKGHEVHWITLYPPSEVIPEGVHLYHLRQNSPRPLNYLNAVLKIRKLLKKIRPDVFHIHSLALYGLGAFCGFHPLVATAWGSDVLEARGKILREKYVRSILKKADCITCDAYHMHNVMAGLGARPEKIMQINFGVDTKKFYPKSKNEDLRRTFNADGAPVVISMRSLYPIYDIQTLIKAIPLVLGQVPDTKFVVVGIGPEEKRLKDLARSLDVDKNIHFMSSIDNNDLCDYLTSVDVYVSTSLSDAGISASTAEAMACGLPVVITDSGENGKWVTDGENGFLIPVKDPEKLSEKVVHLLKNEQIRREVGKRAKDVIHERNDYYGEMHKMEGIYSGLIAQRR